MRILTAVAVLLLVAVSAHADDAPPTPAKPAPDAAFKNFLYKTPPAAWKRSEVNGNLVFSIPRPPGDFVKLTLFADQPAAGSLAEQFAAAVDADQKAKGETKIEADSQPQFSKAAEGYDTAFRTLRSETTAAHTYNFYLAGQSKGVFNLAAFQTTSDTAFKTFGPDATAFLQSLKLANSLPPDEVAKITSKAADDDAPMLPGFGNPTAQTPTPAPASTPDTPPAPPAPPAPSPAAAQAPANIPTVPLELSPLVVNHALIQRGGKPVDLLKLSQHDMDIASPSLAVAPNGTIHVTFVEQHKTTYAYAVYHRSSADGGKTWTDAKNVSEVMPGITSGRCQVVVDSKNRAYVVWRAGLVPTFPAGTNATGKGPSTNLVYRVLDNGKWSKVINISVPAGSSNQSDGVLASWVTVDAAGRPQVLWTMVTDKYHPELMVGTGYRQHVAAIGPGLIMQSTLDGTSPSAPREAYMSPIKQEPQQFGAGPIVNADGLDDINGYVDAAGNPHLVALADNYAVPYQGKSHVQFLENGKPGAAFDLPDLSFHAWNDYPTLLIDADGKKHVICLFPAGERPCIQDYLLGSDDEPTIIRQAAPVKGRADGMQAFQGPGGRMIVLMQMNETGEKDGADNYISLSNGHGWSPPVNLTNNAARSKFASSQHGESGVAIETTYGPGPGAAAFCPDGHVTLIMIVKEQSLFGTTAFGVDMGSGSSTTPTLRFLKL